MTIFRLQGVEFEWDENKARRNSEKHNVRFEEAVEVFFDPFYREGEASQNHENRNYVIGYSFSQRLLFIIYTERIGSQIRIISARPATHAERRLYAEF